jgi:radical SAM superfamily enzyme YgiQ (UPF0313 family)
MSVIQIKSSSEKNVQSEKPVNFQIKNKSAKIWLADLTYTEQQISSESMPSAIGGIATYTEYNLELENPIRIFKYPETLNGAFERDGIPQIIGFSNYMWNCELSLAFARRIKEVSPETIIVLGGPNFPVSEKEQEKFLRIHPEVDFYVSGEGELSFTILAGILINVDFDKNKINEEIPSVKYINQNGDAVFSNSVERIKDLTEIPSPYLNGKMDEFFDGKLQPVIQTTRGCPFTCTFCVEGTGYYNKVNRNSREKTDNELEYIAKKMQDVRHKGGRNDLWIVDSNFGMYSQDIEACQKIAKCQQEYDWPEYIQVDTGKNNKPRVLEAARLVDGAIRLSGSVQTLDKEVLANIKRSNISADQLMGLAKEAEDVGADSRSEIILSLPGESLKSHYETLRTIINSGFNHVNTYQLMMLPGTELSDPATRTQYEMKTRYRVLPRCFSTYNILNKKIHIAEIEEICVSTNSLSFDDYVKTRKMHLLIHIFHNDGIFGSIIKLINYLDLSVFRWLELLYHESLTGDLDNLFMDFENETRNELWEEKNDLVEEIKNSDIVDRYVKGELGYNLLFVYKARAITKNLDGLHVIAKNMLLKLLKENKLDSTENIKFADEIVEYDYGRLVNLFLDLDYVPKKIFEYNISKFLQEEINEIDVCKEINPIEIEFVLEDNQKEILERSFDMYGKNNLGISRLLSKVFVKKLLRKPLVIKTMQTS